MSFKAPPNHAPVNIRLSKLRQMFYPRKLFTLTQLNAHKSSKDTSNSMHQLVFNICRSERPETLLLSSMRHQPPTLGLSELLEMPPPLPDHYNS